MRERLRVMWLGVFGALVIFPTAGLAQEPDGSQPADRLQPLAYLVGGTWTAEGEISGFGSYTAERSYEWVLDHKFIEQRHVMNLSGRKMETMGILGWDPKKKALLAWGFGSDGGIVRSNAVDTNPNEIRFEGNRVGPFNAGPIRATFQKISDDEFLEIAEVKQGDDWQPMFTFRFRRTR